MDTQSSPFITKTYVPVATQSIKAFEVPSDVAIDVLTDQFPSAQPGDYIQVDDAGTPLRAWTKSEFESTYVEQA